LIGSESGADWFYAAQDWWVRAHEPELWSRVRSVMLPKDYVRFKLTVRGLRIVADASEHCCLMW